MSYTDENEGLTLDFDLGGGPDAWEVVGARITDEDGGERIVSIPLAQAVKVLTEAASMAAAALAAQAPLPDPLAHGGEVTHILDTVEDISFHMIEDEGIVWETRKGWQIQWVPSVSRWQLTRPGGRSTRQHMGHWTQEVGAEHYPILGITVDIAPKVIHDGELHKLPQAPQYRYKTNRGLTIKWDVQRGQFIAKHEGPRAKAEFWDPARLLEGLAPNHFPIRRTS